VGDSLYPASKTAWEAFATATAPVWREYLRVRHVTAHVDDGSIRPIRSSDISIHPSQDYYGRQPWHGNRITSDPKSAWHNFRGKRSHNMLFGDGHAQFYLFPKK